MFSSFSNVSMVRLGAIVVSTQAPELVPARRELSVWKHQSLSDTWTNRTAHADPAVW